MTNESELSASAKHKVIEAAAKAKNPLEGIEYEKYKSKSGQEFTLYCRTKSDMNAKTVKWAFKLAEQNVSPYYKELKMGWKPLEKKSYLNKQWARYLVALDSCKNPVAYAMFRFDMDYGDAVIYVYEIQIDQAHQRQGLGKHIMHVLEACAHRWKLEKIILTGLKNNQSGLEFFKSLDYKLDSTSPDDEDIEYCILSKSTL